MHSEMNIEAKNNVYSNSTFIIYAADLKIWNRKVICAFLKLKADVNDAQESCQNSDMLLETSF